MVREFDVELEDAVGAPHLRERNRGAAAGFDARVRSSLALAGDGAAVGLRGETEAVLGRPRGAAHAATARSARAADGGHSWQRRVTELERRVPELTTTRVYSISPATSETRPSTQSRNGAVSSRMARIA